MRVGMRIRKMRSGCGAFAVRKMAAEAVSATGLPSEKRGNRVRWSRKLNIKKIGIGG